MAVSPNRLFSSIFSTMYNLFNTYVTDPASSNRNTSRGSSKWIFASFPDADIQDSKIKYPLIVIDPIDTSYEDWTLTKNKVTITFTFSIYSLTMQQADEILDDCVAIIDSQRTYLRDFSLRQVTLMNTSTDFLTHGGARVHVRTATYNMTYYFTSGIAKHELTAPTIESESVIG